jgi:hypothetical protein
VAWNLIIEAHDAVNGKHGQQNARTNLGTDEAQQLVKETHPTVVTVLGNSET